MVSSAYGASRCGGWTRAGRWQATGGKPSHSERLTIARPCTGQARSLDDIPNIAVDTAAVREARRDRADHVAMAVGEEVMAEEALRALPHLASRAG